MSFERISDKLSKIDELLAAGRSMRSIAREVGCCKSTVQKYKVQCFDLKPAVRAEWQAERAKDHAQRMDEGKARIVDSLELINKVKLRAEELLNIEATDAVIDREADASQDPDKKAYQYTYSGVTPLWSQGARMAVDAIRQEQEITGEDPLGRLADGAGNWLDIANAAAEALTTAAALADGPEVDPAALEVDHGDFQHGDE